MSKQILIFVCLAPLIYAFCGQWDQQTVGDYILYNDLWGIGGASGNQCTSAISQSGSVVTWETEWSWSGGSGVKSYANLALNTGLNKQLSAVSSIPTTWSWTYTYSGNIAADVAYDIWTSDTSGGAHKYEIMIWLAKYGDVEPISAHYNASGLPVPIDSVTIENNAYKLYAGTVSSWTVYSFVADKTITSFSADIKQFFTYLINQKLLASSQYLVGLQAGTEPTSGYKATLTSKYSAQIN